MAQSNQRLTKALKNAIRENALAKAENPARRKALREAGYDWAESVRLLALGGAEEEQHILKIEQKIKRLLGALPEHVHRCDVIVSRSTYITARVAGILITARLRTPAIRSQKVYTINATDPLAKQWQAMMDERKDLDETEAAVHAQVGAMIDSVKTVGQLLKLWPEAKALLPTAETPDRTLPTLPVNNLNKLLGLP